MKVYEVQVISHLCVCVFPTLVWVCCSLQGPVGWCHSTCSQTCHSRGVWRAGRPLSSGPVSPLYHATHTPHCRSRTRAPAGVQHENRDNSRDILDCLSMITNTTQLLYLFNKCLCWCHADTARLFWLLKQDQSTLCVCNNPLQYLQKKRNLNINNKNWHSSQQGSNYICSDWKRTWLNGAHNNHLKLNMN